MSKIREGCLRMRIAEINIMIVCQHWLEWGLDQVRQCLNLNARKLILGFTVDYT